MWPSTENRIRAMLTGMPFFSEYDDQFDHGIVVLSYEGIEEVYQDLAVEFSKFAIALDLTENEITDLSFLKTFHKLQSLVLDKNRHMNPKTMPLMRNLQILWLNGCNITDISQWIDVIRVKCPKLRCLSLINNPGAKSLVNLSTSHENDEYRSYIANKMKKLEILDEAPVVRSGLSRMTSGQFLSRLFHFNNDKKSDPVEKESQSDVVADEKAEWWTGQHFTELSI